MEEAPLMVAWAALEDGTPMAGPVATASALVPPAPAVENLASPADPEVGSPASLVALVIVLVATAEAKMLMSEANGPMTATLKHARSEPPAPRKDRAARKEPKLAVEKRSIPSCAIVPMTAKAV